MLCNTVQQDRVPLAWFRWNLFSYSLAEKARRWLALASFEEKKELGHFGQHVRKQVINFM
jgi:hypothetical protein